MRGRFYNAKMTDSEYKRYLELRLALRPREPASKVAYLQVEEARDDSAVVQSLLAETALAYRHLDVAEAAAKKLSSEHPGAWSLATEASMSAHRGNLEAARLVVESALSADSDNLAALNVAVSIHQLLGRFDVARYMARRTYEVNHEDPAGYAPVVAVAISERDFDSVRALVDDSPEPFRSTSSYYHALADIARRDYRYEEALGALKTALEIRPFRVLTHAKMAVVLLKQGRIPEAKSIALRGLDIDRNSAVLHVTLGTIAAREGKHAESEQYRRKAVELSPLLKPFEHGHAADQFYAAGMAREALRALDFMERDGDFNATQVALLKRLAPLADMRRWTELESTMAKVHRFPADPALLAVARARLASHKGSVDTAINLLESEFVANPKDGQVLRWLLIFGADSKDASLLRRVTDLGVERIATTDRKAFALLRAFYGVKAFELADEALDTVRAKYPESELLRGMDAWRHRRLGNTNRASELCQGLKPAWENWKPPDSLLPPKHDFWHTELRRLRRRFLGR